MTREMQPLLDRARAGDGQAFGQLVEPYRRELEVHCYRMLGSLQDAEDAVQETFLAAWRGLDGFQERSSLRTWLYRIATNRCLNMRRASRRRAPKDWDVDGVQPPAPSRLGDVVWLEPLPEHFLQELPASTLGPEARFEILESVSLAFITALQLLPPRQLAVLLLRDVLGFPASAVAEMLDTTGGSVNSALTRARGALERHRTDRGVGLTPAPPVHSPEERALLAKFLHAYGNSDVEELVALLTDTAFITMPPLPLEYLGRQAIHRFWSLFLSADHRYVLVPTRANGQPAFGVYLETPDGARRGSGLFVLTLSGDRIGAVTRFESSVFESFRLPRVL
ncbi:RNA polymerase subunit sigma-70 [Diaminobutyricibacter sp. McL0608]|uniref:RNA polymerase subunit sigma-70 n=1 Tax=Leifsonia sp. McL0608 TaxID=3143537 RepID=UPI0031F31C99